MIRSNRTRRLGARITIRDQDRLAQLRWYESLPAIAEAIRLAQTVNEDVADRAAVAVLRTRAAAWDAGWEQPQRRVIA